MGDFERKLGRQLRWDERGLTLMELIIAITFMAVISLAAFAGFQFAYNAFIASHEYIGEVYDAQIEFENQLAMTFIHPTNMSESDIETFFGLASEEAESDPITFDWGYYSAGTWDGTSPLDDFDVAGVTVILESQGADYLEKPIYVYIPVNSQEH